MGFFGSLFGGGNPYQNLVNQSGAQYGTLTGEAGNLFSQGQADQSLLSPFFRNEMTNPQGLGATTMSQLLTQSGQSVAGGAGAQKQRALDIGARTGNTAAIPGIINSAGKGGMVAQGNNSLNLGIQNAMLKQQQQQQGAAGLGGLFKEDTGSSLEASNLANSAFQNLMKSKQLSVNQENQNAGKEFNDIMSVMKMFGG